MVVNESMYQLGSVRSAIRELFEYGKKRAAIVGKENVYDFSIGNPSIPAPQIVNNTIKELVTDYDSVALHGYTSAQGDVETRAAIAEFLNNTHGTHFNADNLYMTMGAAASLSICFRALTSDAYDEFITIAPYFPEYKVFVNAAGDKAQYDTHVKRLLAQKSILAHILVKTIDEFKGMKPEDVVKYIEGEPSISVVPVEPGLANTEKTDAAGQRIVGLNTENAEINEGLVRFDIIFYVRMKNGLSQIIVNIEAQKDEPTEYKILNRAIFYVSRLISSQKERDFVNTNYDDIKQVFSIWICMNMDDNSLSHIHLTKDELLKPCNWKGNLDLLNIVLIGITNEIPEHDEKYEMHRLIGALLSSELKEQEKLDIIEHEYNIPTSQEFREDVRIMCNLSTGIEERATERATKKATEKTSEKFILNMYKKGYTLDQIADVAETGVDEVEAIIKKKEPAMA